MKRSTGDIIRYWRRNRGLSQMALANSLNVSFRHINYIENDKSKASRALLLQLSQELNLSLRACNALLSASGYAEEFRQTNLSVNEDEQARLILESILEAIEPNPAMITDKNLNIVMCNPGMDLIIDTFATNPEGLRANPMTIYRLNFHPDGVKDAIVNRKIAIGSHLGRLHRALESAEFECEDVDHYYELRELANQLNDEQGGSELDKAAIESPHLVIPIELKRGKHRISLYTTITSLGTPQDVSLQELQIDIGFPTDDESRAFFHQAALRKQPES